MMGVIFLFLFALLLAVLMGAALSYGVFGRDRRAGKTPVEKRRNWIFFTLSRWSFLIPCLLDFVLIYEATKFALGETNEANKSLIITIITFSVVFPTCGAILLLGIKGWEWIAKRFMNENEIRTFQVRRVKRKPKKNFKT
jgi:hypothetical protein